MAVISLHGFGGMAPSTDAVDVPDNMAVYAQNCDSRFGNLRPFAEPATVGSANPGKTLYRFANGSNFISKTGDVNFVRGQIPNDDTERTYFTGDGKPQVIDSSMAVRQLGVPRPVAAPVAKLVKEISFTVDDANAAKKKAPVTLANAVRDAISWQYRGLADADLSELHAVPERPWEYDVIRGGHVVNGGFIPDSPSDVNLMSAELKYRSDANALYVGLFVRAGVWLLDKSRLSASLTALASIDTTAAAGSKMLTEKQVSDFVKAADDYFSSRDKEIAPIVAKIKAAKQRFVSLVVEPTTVTNATQGTVDTYYAKPEVVATIDAAVAYVAEAMANTASDWQINRGLTKATATTAIKGFIIKKDDGSKTLNTPAAKSWAETELKAIAPDARRDRGEITSVVDPLFDYLMAELNKLRMPVAGLTDAGLSNLNSISGTGSNSVTKTMVDLQQEMENLVVSIEQMSKALLDGIDKKVASLFEGDISTSFPVGEIPIVTARAYVLTEVTDWGEESTPSPVSNIIELDQNDWCTVSLPAAAGGRHITKRRLYRSASGSNSSAFLLQGEYPASTVLVEDKLPSERLNETCPSFGWDEPLADLQGLVGMPNGIMLGFTGATLHACEPYAPYAWPARYDIPLEYPIVGIAVAGQTAVVTTTGIPYLVTGADSASLSAEKLPRNQSCMAKRSMVAIAGAVLYASPDGVVSVEGGDASVISNDRIAKTDWEKYNPASMFAAEYDGRYHLFYTTINGQRGCLVFDLTTRSIVEHGSNVDAVYSDKASDTLYALSGGSIVNLMPARGKSMVAVWKSKIFRLPKPAPFAWLQVYANFAASGSGATPANVRVDLYADGMLWRSKQLSSAAPLRLPPGRFREIQIQVTSDVWLSSVTLASTTAELKAVS